MNDFTKEELKSTLYALNNWVSPECDYPAYYNLRIKIHYMIDNYCEHEYSPEDALNVPTHCLKCGDKFE